MQIKNLQPLGDKVLIKLDKRDDVSEGGIILPDSAKKKAYWGTIIAKGEEVKRPIEAGDKVFFDKYASQDIKASPLSASEAIEFVVVGEESIYIKVTSSTPQSND